MNWFTRHWYHPEPPATRDHIVEYRSFTLSDAVSEFDDPTHPWRVTAGPSKNFSGMSCDTLERLQSAIDSWHVTEEAVAYWKGEDLSGLSVAQCAALGCARLAYLHAHGDYRGTAYPAANIATAILFAYGIQDREYGSPYTSHANCKCGSCESVRRNNAECDRKSGGPVKTYSQGPPPEYKAIPTPGFEARQAAYDKFLKETA
jgi:hypothetical protein